MPDGHPRGYGFTEPPVFHPERERYTDAERARENMNKIKLYIAKLPEYAKTNGAVPLSILDNALVKIFQAVKEHNLSYPLERSESPVQADGRSEEVEASVLFDVASGLNDRHERFGFDFVWYTKNTAGGPCYQTGIIPAYYENSDQLKAVVQRALEIS